MRRAVLACVMLIVSITHVPVTSHADGPTFGADRVSMWRLSRARGTAQTVGVTRFEVTVHVSGTDLRSSLVMAAAEPLRDRWRWYFVGDSVDIAIATWAPSPAYPFAYTSSPAGAVRSPDCPDPALCRSSAPGRFTINVSVSARQDVILAAHNIDVVLQTIPKGWTARKIPNPRAIGGDLRVLQGWETGHGAGVYSYQYVNLTLEHFVGPVELPGGRYGSWARAYLPCAPAALVVPPADGAAGIGGGTLTAYDARRRNLASMGLNCGYGRYRVDTGVDGGAPVTWRLDGEAVGFAVVPSRLVVLSLPKP